LTEYHDRHTMERMREHLARADSELEVAQHFLDPGSAEGAEMDLIRAVAAARVAVGDALEAVRLRVGESDRG
jgi:predicted urease superfamily metal-dependent hydrolase